MAGPDPFHTHGRASRGAGNFDTIRGLGQSLRAGSRFPRRAHPTMILIEPAIQAKYGRAVRRRALTAFLAQAADAARLEGEISVLLTTDKDIRRLNLAFRKQDKATDVLSFPAPDAVGPLARAAGDLAISVETAARQAEEAGHALHAELEVLLLHGVLHLAGYDHEADNGQMARREAALQRKFGLSPGLIERTAGGRTGQAAPQDGGGRRS
jgi:probable rRNA maturation factor